MLSQDFCLGCASFKFEGNPWNFQMSKPWQFRLFTSAYLVHHILRNFLTTLAGCCLLISWRLYIYKLVFVDSLRTDMCSHSQTPPIELGCHRSRTTFIVETRDKLIRSMAYGPDFAASGVFLAILRLFAVRVLRFFARWFALHVPQPSRSDHELQAVLTPPPTAWLLTSIGNDPETIPRTRTKPMTPNHAKEWVLCLAMRKEWALTETILNEYFPGSLLRNEWGRDEKENEELGDLAQPWRSRELIGRHSTLAFLLLDVERATG